jgi:hypothetical protein
MDIGGSKVRNIESWGTPEANLIHARAIEFFSIAVDKKPSEVKLDVCWASISRKYEYLSPHSHTHSIGSVVYSLLPGEKVPDKYLDGLLCFLDPRIPDCCPVEDEAATKEIAPNMEQGAMVIFPSNLIHYVHPYTGDTPRITLAWNFYL